MNMKKILLFISLAMVMAACVKPDEPVRFSILGDSFSSYKGYVTPETNDVFPYDKIGVTGPEQMWWAQVADSTGWIIERNNSFSGTLVSNFQDFNSGTYYAPNSFICRMDNLGNPDVILVFGATNDIYQRAPLGEYVYADWTEEQLCTFRPAMCYIIDGLKRQYPKAEIYVLVDMELCINDHSIEEETRQAFIESMHHVAEHYHVKSIDIFGIHKSSWHPNVQGQEDIARQVIEALLPEINV